MLLLTGDLIAETRVVDISLMRTYKEFELNCDGGQTPSIHQLQTFWTLSQKKNRRH